MADWPCFGRDGVLRVIRLELEPIFCVNCGKPNGFVPRGIMSFVSWLCLPCSETWGETASLWESSDREFWRKVAYEMVRKYGRGLTQEELFRLGEQGRLGSLALLARESPFKGS
jgi:hypothetical protein